MSRWKIVSGMFIILCLMTATTWHLVMEEHKTLRVGFPLQRLRQDQLILDPDNLEWVHQYYLLENLAIGLVRDSNQSPSGYSAALADSWAQLTPKKWVFRLHPDLKWSDGTAITAEAIAAHLLSLRNGKYRHIVYLKELVHVRIEDGGALILEFRTPVNGALLQELSLADTAIVYPRNQLGRWGITSGPYCVERYEIGKRLTLRRNPYFRYSGDYPATVQLVDLARKTAVDLFRESKVDLMRLRPPLFSKSNQEAMASSPQVLRGYPTAIYYFYFNPANRDWSSAAARQQFSRLVGQAFEGLQYPDLAREYQFIPKGFPGRIQAISTARSANKSWRFRQNLLINVLPTMTDFQPVLDILKSRLAKEGVNITFQYGWDDSSNNTADVFLSQFSGNAKDALASWSFLFAERVGHLSPYRSEVASFFKKIIGARNNSTRNKWLLELHKQVIEKAYAIPLFIEPPVILASNRIDLSSFNLFDVRFRFYELSWK